MNKLNTVLDNLIKKRWSVVENYFPQSLCADLNSELQQFHSHNLLVAAKIGKNQQKHRQQTFRGDSILWLSYASQAQQDFLDLMEELRNLLNHELFLGLDELESHFAHYPAGTGYKKHLDSFKNNNLRRITIVSYLNPTWSTEDGGELIIYGAGDTVIASVQPIAGTLVCFVSEEFPHEVVIAHQARASIAGWFRGRG